MFLRWREGFITSASCGYSERGLYSFSIAALVYVFFVPSVLECEHYVACAGVRVSSSARLVDTAMSSGVSLRYFFAG
jgi:hypothetical protein